MYHFTISHLLISALVEFTFCIGKCLNQIKEMFEHFSLFFWLQSNWNRFRCISLPFLSLTNCAWKLVARITLEPDSNDLYGQTFVHHSTMRSCVERPFPNLLL